MSAVQSVVVYNATTQTDTMVRITSNEKPNPNRLMLLKWQNMLDFVANLFRMEVSKITRIQSSAIDVLIANSQSDLEGATNTLGMGSMDETVISRGDKLVVENVEEADYWQMDQGLPVAYMGLAIEWPDHEIFGTLSIEDMKVHRFSQRYHKVMDSFREMVNTDLALLIKSDHHKKRSTFIQAQIAPIKTGICLYDEEKRICSWNQSAEEVLAYKAEEVLGMPVSFIFPMFEQIEGPDTYTVVAANNELKSLYIEKSTMLGVDEALVHVLSFSDQTAYLSQNTGGVGELHRDEQSGLYNHYSIVDILNQEAKRALRYRQPLTVLGVRINGYDFIENLHGHGSLDLIVQTLAIILKNETRDVDSIGRLSDELFVVCLPNTKVKPGGVVSQRIAKVSARYSDDQTPFTVKTACMEVKDMVLDWETSIMEVLNKD